MTGTHESDDRAAEARAFLATFRSLVLSSVSDEGVPEASYAPFVRWSDNAFYIYVSRLARHTGNLLATPRASILFLEDEATASQLFARKRLTLACQVDVVERSSDAWNEILDAFEAKFGEVMGMIRPLEDFVLFRLQPSGGTYVRGFAQAYRFTGADVDEFRHINDVGHTRAAD